MKDRKTITISKPEYELQAESAVMWEMTNDYGEQRDDGTWEHPFFDVIRRLHPQRGAEWNEPLVIAPPPRLCSERTDCIAWAIQPPALSVLPTGTGCVAAA
jgi:hypothetical protein